MDPAKTAAEGRATQLPDRWRSLIVADLNSCVGSPEHFEVRERMAQLADADGFFDAGPSGARDDVPDDAPDDPPAAAFDASSWPYVVDRVTDFRADVERASDAALSGAWWRCPFHGLTSSPVELGPAAYCDRGDCRVRVLQVSGGSA